jgi:hypothetical protein
LDDLGVEILEHAAEGGDIGQPLQAQQAQDDGVVLVEAEISEMAKAEQKMDDQAEHEDGVIVGGLNVQVPDASPHAVTQIEALKQGLEDDQAGEGSELLIFESQSRESSGFTLDVFSAKLHRGGLLGLDGFF